MQPSTNIAILLLVSEQERHRQLNTGKRVELVLDKEAASDLKASQGAYSLELLFLAAITQSHQQRPMALPR